MDLGLAQGIYSNNNEGFANGIYNGVNAGGANGIYNENLLSVNIVKNGLVLYLDAAYPKSYSRTGNNWNDLSGKLNNGTLTNGPAFNLDNGGSIVFDGTNDYVIANTPNLINLNNSVSICMTIKDNNVGSLSTQFSRYIEMIDANGISVQILRDLNLGVSTKNTKFQTGLNANYWFTPTFNVIYIIGVVWDTISNTTTFYRNGILLASNNFSNVGIGNQTNKTYLGVRSDLQGSTYLIGNIYNIQIYNRALSQSEINQNYQATKSRFGL